MLKYKIKKSVEKKQIVTRIISSLPYLIIFSLLAVFLFTCIIKGSESAIRGLVKWELPAGLASLLLVFFKAKGINLRESLFFRPIKQTTSILVFGILFNISLWILILLPYRPWYYFLIISLLYGLVTYQIFSKKFNQAIVLLEIGLIMANMIYGLALKYPLYFSGTDTLRHIFFVRIISISGHIIPSEISPPYASFPLYHIWVCTSSYISSLSISHSLFLVNCPFYVLTIVYLYYIFYAITKNKQVSLLGCLLYSTDKVVILYGTYIVTRVVASVGFILLLYLIYREKNKKRSFYLLIGVILIFILLVHQVSILYCDIIILLLLICEWLIDANRNYIRRYSFLFLFISFAALGYWFFISKEFINTLVEELNSLSIIKPFMLSPSTPTEGNVYNAIYYLLESLKNYPLIFFTLVGIGYVLWKKRYQYISVFGLLTLFTLIFYFPSPLYYFRGIHHILRIDRFRLLVAPFVALMMGWGIVIVSCYLVDKNISRKVIVSSAILLIIGYSIGSMVTNPYFISDCKDISWKPLRKYFTSEEIWTFKYVASYIPSRSFLYSDYYVARYFQTGPSHGCTALEQLNLKYYPSKKLSGVEEITDCRGYILIREKEFSEEGLYFGPQELFYRYSSSPKNKLFLHKNLRLHNKIYSSYILDIYYS